MFKNIIDLLMILVIILFSFSVLRHYSSINNINDISFKRDNIENTLRNKIENLPILPSNTKDVIKFNSGFENEIKNSEPRSFWQLLKLK
tara:strand:- start:161 stop:427 length:267 start_codon:yes stop_codon:yes gene_type:complete